METNIKPPTEEEVAAQQAEARKISAESEFAIIAGDKKRVLAETAKLEQDLKESKAILVKNNADIESTKKNLKNVQGYHQEESAALDKLKIEKKEFQKDFEDFKKSSEVKRSEITAALLVLQKQGDVAKEKGISELREIEDSKNALLAEIRDKNIVLDSLKKEEAGHQIKIKDLTDSHESLTQQKFNLEKNISSFAGELSSHQENLKAAKEQILEVNAEISEKEAVIKTLDSSIENKKAEYKIEEDKLFALHQKEITLNQKETFIKDQFARAGVKWPD